MSGLVARIRQWKGEAMKVQDLPRSPDAIQGGRLGALRQACEADQAAIVAARDAVAALQQQMLGYRQLIARATPTSDMGAVAAALAGEQIVERALVAAEGQVAQRELEALRNSQWWADAWASYRSLWESAAMDELAHDTPSPRALAELRALAVDA